MRMIFVFIIVILFTSCKKELPFNFTGKVTDKLNNRVANATIELIAYYNSTNAITPGGLSKLATTTTNALGEFKVSFNQSENIKYYHVNVFAKKLFSIYPGIY